MVRNPLTASLAALGVVFAIFVALLVRELARVFRDNVAVGPVVFVRILFNPSFWLIALPAFVIAFWIASRSKHS